MIDASVIEESVTPEWPEMVAGSDFNTVFYQNNTILIRNDILVKISQLQSKMLQHFTTPPCFCG